MKNNICAFRNNMMLLYLMQIDLAGTVYAQPIINLYKVSSDEPLEQGGKLTMSYKNPDFKFILSIKETETHYDIPMSGGGRITRGVSVTRACELESGKLLINTKGTYTQYLKAIGIYNCFSCRGDLYLFPFDIL